MPFLKHSQGRKNGLHHHRRVGPGAAYSVRRRLMNDRRWWLVNAMFALVVALVLLSPGRAHAAGTVPGQTTQGVPRYAVTELGEGGARTSYNAAAQVWFDYWQGQDPGGRTNGNCGGNVTTPILMFQSGNYVDARYTCAGQAMVSLTYREMVLWDYLGTTTSCPSNSTASGNNVCTCNTGYNPDANGAACIPTPNACAASLGKALTGEITIPVTGQVTPASTCYSGCTYLRAFDSGGVWGTLNGSWTWAGKGADFIGNGSGCTATPTGTGSPTEPGAAPLPNPPPKGMCPGTVNGVAVNVPCDTTSTGGATGGSGSGGITPPPPGASGGAASPGAAGSPGAGSFSGSAPTAAPPGAKPGDKGSSGTCTGDKCATTECVVVLKADFSMEKQCGTTYEDKGTFCKNNPGDPKCKAEQSSFVGTCEAPVACTGDAVQCQVAKQQLADSCDARKVSDATQAIYTGLKGTGVSVTGLDAQLNIGGMLPSGPSQTCALSDTSFQLGEGFSVSMPLGTLLCDKLGVIRGVIAAFGFVMWSIIVFGLRGN